MMELPPISNQLLLQQALTHSSYVNEHPSNAPDNERLEFLGDAVLGFLIGEMLYKRYPNHDEAELTRLRSRLVDEPQLAQIAREMGIGSLLRLGKGAQKDNARDNPSLLSNTLEAIIAAYFLDAGIEAVKDYIEPMFGKILDRLTLELDPQHLVDFKNRFQQWALANIGENPKYSIIHESGPDHAKEFTAQVSVKGVIYGQGTGHRKQEAQKRAAESALKYLKIL